MNTIATYAACIHFYAIFGSKTDFNKHIRICQSAANNLKKKKRTIVKSLSFKKVQRKRFDSIDIFNIRRPFDFNFSELVSADHVNLDTRNTLKWTNDL